MALIRIDKNPSRWQLNLFGLLWLVFLTALGATVRAKTGSAAWASWIWLAAIVIPLVGWIWPKWMRRAYLASAYAALPIGMVVSFTLLVLVYYAVLTPLGLFLRIGRFDLMATRRPPRSDSYWQERSTQAPPENYFRQF